MGLEHMKMLLMSGVYCNGYWKLFNYNNYKDSSFNFIKPSLL